MLLLRLCDQVDHPVCFELAPLAAAEISDLDRAVRGSVEDRTERLRRKASASGRHERTGPVSGPDVRAALLRPVQEGEERHGVEDKQSEPVAFPEAARFLDDAVDPFESAPLHPARRGYYRCWMIIQS